MTNKPTSNNNNKNKQPNVKIEYYIDQKTKKLHVATIKKPR